MTLTKEFIPGGLIRLTNSDTGRIVAITSRAGGWLARFPKPVVASEDPTKTTGKRGTPDDLKGNGNDVA